MIKIVTDSTANLSDKILARYDIRKVPIAIQFGAETYEEDVDIDRDTFYRKIEETGIIAHIPAYNFKIPQGKKEPPHSKWGGKANSYRAWKT